MDPIAHPYRRSPLEAAVATTAAAIAAPLTGLSATTPAQAALRPAVTRRADGTPFTHTGGAPPHVSHQLWLDPYQAGEPYAADQPLLLV